MTTLVVSDLHLGARSGVDLLRRPEVRERLLAAAAETDRLVLLGDVLELREGAVADVLAAARPALEALGDAVGERPVVVLPGNHDHPLLAQWRERLRGGEKGESLGLEEWIEPGEGSAAAAALAEWMAPAQVRLAYPGTWLASRVYATHGHYLDRHITVPAFEPLAIRAVERVVRGRGLQGGAAGYEAVLSPVYAALHELAQSVPARPGTPSEAQGGGFSGRAYRVLAGDGSARRPLTHRLLGGAAFPAAVAALNAVGLGPLRADLSGPELRRSSLRAMGEVLRRLGVEADHVVFGHTHRAGPLPRDDPAEWMAGGARLHNAGSWVIERYLGGRTPQTSPYRAGAAIRVDGDGPPELFHLLDDLVYAGSV